MKLVLLKAVLIKSGVIPKRFIFCTSSSRQYSFVLPPITLTSDTPSTCDKNGLMVYMASSFISMGDFVLLSSEYPITGSIDGFIFSTVICTSGGKSFLISLIFDSMRCRLMSTSASQLRKADNSQLPRLVMLRMVCKSCTCLMAFSKGLVTVIIILSIGCCPASAITFILGKVISGNKEVCILV